MELAAYGAAAMSKAIVGGTQLDTIFLSGGWSKESTTQELYTR